MTMLQWRRIGPVRFIDFESSTYYIVCDHYLGKWAAKRLNHSSAPFIETDLGIYERQIDAEAACLRNIMFRLKVAGLLLLFTTDGRSGGMVSAWELQECVNLLDDTRVCYEDVYLVAAHPEDVTRVESGLCTVSNWERIYKCQIDDLERAFVNREEG